jgi:glutamate---cysteine ligase / carboxylate-amine ligase
MAIRFAPSARSTLGVEWELALVDARTGDLVPLAPEVLATVAEGDDREGERFTAELLTNTVEIVSGVHERVGDAVADLSLSLQRVSERAAALGAEVMCAGTHPFARVDAQVVTEKERYVELVDRMQVYARQLLIWGVHCHVGVDDPAKAMPIVSALTTFYPHLQALSASSPYFEGTPTGYASTRAMLFQQLPSAGLPPQLLEWSEYEDLVGDLERVGMIDHWDEIRWDVRPSAKWGTVETRISDGAPTTLEVGASAALVQCIVDDCSQAFDDGHPLPILQPWYVRENKWRAARYGMETEVIVDRHGTEQPVRDAIRDLVARLEPAAARLGCEAELADVLRIVERGASYERQAVVAAEADGDLRAVVTSLVSELRDGFPA